MPSYELFSSKPAVARNLGWPDELFFLLACFAFRWMLGGGSYHPGTPDFGYDFYSYPDSHPRKFLSRSCRSCRPASCPTFHPSWDDEVISKANPCPFRKASLTLKTHNQAFRRSFFQGIVQVTSSFSNSRNSSFLAARTVTFPFLFQFLYPHTRCKTSPSPSSQLLYILI